MHPDVRLPDEISMPIFDLEVEDRRRHGARVLRGERSRMSIELLQLRLERQIARQDEVAVIRCRKRMARRGLDSFAVAQRQRQNDGCQIAESATHAFGALLAGLRVFRFDQVTDLHLFDVLERAIGHQDGRARDETVAARDRRFAFDGGFGGFAFFGDRLDFDAGGAFGSGH